MSTNNQPARRTAARSSRKPVRKPITREIPISRQIILEATRNLYARSDSTSVTMREIANEVGCQSPSLYHHFASKDDIFWALVEEADQLFERYRSAVDTDDCLTRLRERFSRYYEFSKVYPDYFMLLFVDPASPAARRSPAQRARGGAETIRQVTECIAAGHFPPGTDPQETGQVLWGAMHGISVLRLRMQNVPSDHFDRLAQRTLDLIMGGIATGLLGPSAR